VVVALAAHQTAGAIAREIGIDYVILDEPACRVAAQTLHYPASGCHPARHALSNRAVGQDFGDHRHDETGPRPLPAAVDGLRHVTDGLGPTNGLPDPLPLLVKQGIIVVSGGAPVDGNTRGDTGLPEAGDELGALISFVRDECQATRRSPGNGDAPCPAPPCIRRNRPLPAGHCAALRQERPGSDHPA